MISIKNQNEIEIMREAGKMLAGILNKVVAEVRVGIATKELDELASKLIFDSHAIPSFKNYGGFPAVLCVSINEQIVHGVPSERIIQEGDIVSLDLGLKYGGYHADMAVTIPVGTVDSETLRLIRTGKKALKRAIARTKPGKTLGDIGHAIQTYIEDQGFEIPRELCGHGVGRELQEKPEVLNIGQRHKGIELKPGMVIAIEPMVIAGKRGIEIGPDGFSYQTVDKSMSVHFEHTIAVTKDGPFVLTAN